MTRTVAEKYHSSTELVAIKAAGNYLVPTDQEAFSLYDQEHRNLSDVLYALEQEETGHRACAHAATYELLDDSEEVRASDPFAYQIDISGEKEARLARIKRSRTEEGRWGLVKIFGGILLALFTAFVGAVDYALFVSLFREGYLNQFGELPANMEVVVAILAGQAIVAVAGFHFFLHSPKARTITGVAIGILLLLFLAGVVVHRGVAEVAKASVAAASAPFGWNISEPAANSAGVSLWEGSALFALGIPYFVLPLVAALVGWAAFIAFRDGLRAQFSLSAFNSRYLFREEHTNAGLATASKAVRLRQEWPTRVKAPVMELVDARLKQAAILNEWSVKSRMFSSVNGGGGLLIPGTQQAQVRDPELVARIAIEARTVLEGFVDRSFDAWRLSRGFTPDRMGGI